MKFSSLICAEIIFIPSVEQDGPRDTINFVKHSDLSEHKEKQVPQ